MKAGIELAAKNKKEIAFIDQPIEITLKNIGWKEGGRFFFFEIMGIIFCLKKDIEDIEEKITYLEKWYPYIHKALIDDRDKYMVKELIQIMRKNPEKKIMVIVGEGHLKGMKELLLKDEVVI